MADTSGYIQSSEQFDIMPEKQKLFTYVFDYFDVNEKSIKKPQFIHQINIFSQAVLPLNIKLKTKRLM